MFAHWNYSPINNKIILKIMSILSELYNIVTILFGIVGTHWSKTFISNNRAHVWWNLIYYYLINSIKFIFTCEWILKCNNFPAVVWTNNWSIKTYIYTCVYLLLIICSTSFPLLVNMVRAWKSWSCDMKFFTSTLTKHYIYSKIWMPSKSMWSTWNFLWSCIF